jgi:hypothetical protein
MLAMAGCAPASTRIEFTTFDETGGSERVYGNFTTASYRKIQGGLIEIVCRAETPSTLDPTQTITQVIFMRTFWHPQPGRTFVESTQIDGTVIYTVLTPPTGVRYDGAGFLTFKIKDDGTMEGEIESGTLTPRYRMGEAVIPFTAARIAGRIHAVENPRDVVNTLQSIESQFSERVVPQ